ncbi:MAG: hypothetical protein U5K27_11430 [Desulfotignum sp.]|nr:hypothetical protein [Desulfotignum sp.]
MDRKKQAAVMAAVTAYMTDLEAGLAGQGADSAEIGSEPCGPAVPYGPGFNIWALTGRQVMMQAGTMMQLRMFK